LRNVSLTAPYFHSGSVETLDRAVQQMAELQLGIELTTRERTQIVSFLRTLTGRHAGVNDARRQSAKIEHQLTTQPRVTE